MSAYRPWTEEERERVREGWGQGRSDAELGAELGRTPLAVRGERLRQGLCERKPADWTPSDVAALRLLCGRYPLCEVAARLGRSRNAVRIKAIRLRLRTTHTSEAAWSLNEAARMLGIDRHVLLRWVERGELRVRLWSDREGPRRPRLVYRDDLASYVRTHPGCCNPAKMPEGRLRDAVRREGGERARAEHCRKARSHPCPVPPGYVSIPELARRMGVWQPHIRDGIRRGRFVAERLEGWGKRPWLIREDLLVPEDGLVPTWREADRGCPPVCVLCGRAMVMASQGATYRGPWLVRYGFPPARARFHAQGTTWRRRRQQTACEPCLERRQQARETAA